LGKILGLVLWPVAASLQSETLRRRLEREPVHEQQVKEFTGMAAEGPYRGSDAPLFRIPTAEWGAEVIRAAIVGCGKIADQHAAALKRIPGCEIVGVCDTEELMAKQLCERFQTGSYFCDVNELLERTQPDAVHITTPAQSHFTLGKLCLQAGCHVYIEKPFTLNTAEAEQLIRLALENELVITAGHNAQFSHAARRMRELVRTGFLGGPPVHIESYYCYDLNDESYARAFLSDRGHWVRSLPGKLLHNIISHGISKIVEFLADTPEVIAHGFSSPYLQNFNERDLVDEVRVIIHDRTGDVTAYFTFSSQMRPLLHQLRVYGPKNCLIADDDNQTLIKVNGARKKSYLEQFVSPCLLGRQYFGNSLYNLKKFLTRDFHPDTGMRFLIRSFYHSIQISGPPPIPYREILLTSRIMDSIFQQTCNSGGKIES